MNTRNTKTNNGAKKTTKLTKPPSTSSTSQRNLSTKRGKKIPTQSSKITLTNEEMAIQSKMVHNLILHNTRTLTNAHGTRSFRATPSARYYGQRPPDTEEEELSAQLFNKMQQPRAKPRGQDPNADKIPQAALDHFFLNEPDMKAIVEDAENSQSLLVHDTKRDIRYAENIYIKHSTQDFESIRALKQAQIQQENLDEEALIDSLLYDNDVNDPHEKQLKMTHQKLKDKQKFLQQQRVLNMNEFIKPPVPQNQHFFEASFNSISAGQKQEMEASLEKQAEMDHFQQNILEQRRRLQEQLEEAAKEEKLQIKAEKKRQKQLLRQAEKDAAAASVASTKPTSSSQNTLSNTQNKLKRFVGNENDDSLDEADFGDDDTELDEQQQRKRRAGPAIGADFMSNHGDLFGDIFAQDDNDGAELSGSPYERYRKKKKAAKMPLADDDADGNNDDDDEGDDDDDDLDDQVRQEFDDDINSILSRQFVERPDHVHGIAYDLDSEDESTSDDSATDGKRKAKVNKYGQIIVEDDDEMDYEDAAKSLHLRKSARGNNDGDDDDDEHDENDDGDDPVQDFEFPERVDQGVKNKSHRVPNQWWHRVEPIITLLRETLENPKGFTQRVNLLQGLDTVARLLLELSARTDLPNIPRQVFAHIINISLPRIRTVHGIPQTSARPPTAAIGPFLLLVMNCARQNSVNFSDVEWQWVLTTIAQTANIVNADEVKQVLTDAIELFRSAKVIRGVRTKRTRTSGVRVNKRDAAHTRFVLVSAPNVRLIEQRAWVEFYTYSHNRDLLLPFTRIHDAVVFKPSSLDTPLTRMGFISEHIGEDIMTRPAGIDFHRVDDAFETIRDGDDDDDNNNNEFDFLEAEFDPTSPNIPPPPKTKRPRDPRHIHKFAHYKDLLHNTLEIPLTHAGEPLQLDEEMTAVRSEKLFKNWVSPDHHPQLFNYPIDDDLPYLAYMAASDDVLAEPWLYQPPHFGTQFLPRMSAQFRSDNIAFFPSCINVMAHFTAQGTADVVQAEQFYKYVVNIFTNTEGYYRTVLKNLKKVDQYRTLHGYEPAEDVQMAQGMEAPHGEEFRYFAGYPMIDGLDFTSWRRRATQTIITMTKLLGKLYRYEQRGPQIHNLIQFLLEQKKIYPSLIPVPSMSLLQQYFHTSIRSRDISQARDIVTLMLSLRKMVATPDDDPLLQLSLSEVRNQQHKANQMALRRTAAAKEHGEEQAGNYGIGTNLRFKGKTFHNSEETRELLQRMSQASFDSLQRELDVAVIISQAAIYAVTNNFVAIMELIDSLSKTRDPNQQFDSHRPDQHDYLKSLQYVGPETKTRLFRVVLQFLSTATMVNNSQMKLGTMTASDTQKRVESIYHKVKTDFDNEQETKYPRSVVDALSETDRQQFQELQTQLFYKRVRDMVQPIYDDLLVPKPLIDYNAIMSQSDPKNFGSKTNKHVANHDKDNNIRMTTPATLQPGHVLWLFHQAQRNGAAVTSRLIHDTLALIASFPGNIGSYAAYHFVNDMTGLGFRISRPTLRVIATNARAQAQIARPTLNKLYPNPVIHSIYHQLRDTAVTIPQLMDMGRTEVPTVFFKEFSFLHPSTVFALAKHKNIPLSATMIQDIIYYFGLTRNWVAAVESFHNALDIAYYGNYSVVKRIAKLQKIPMSQITDSLPIKQRRIAFNARKALFMTTSNIGHHRLTFDVLYDWQQSDGIKLLPYHLDVTDVTTRMRSLTSLGEAANVRLFPTDTNDPRSDGIRPLLSVTPQTEDNQLTPFTSIGKQIKNISGDNGEDQMENNHDNDTGISTQPQPDTQNDTSVDRIDKLQEQVRDDQLKLQESINNLAFDQQKLLLQTISKIKQHRQSPISQHFNVTKHARLLHDLHDLLLVGHTATNVPWHRRFMEASGLSPTLHTASKLIVNAIALAVNQPNGAVQTPSGTNKYSSVSRRTKLHIARVTNTDTLSLPPDHQLFIPTLSNATPITKKTNSQIGIDVGYNDFEDLDAYQLKQARIIAQIEPHWDELKDDVIKTGKFSAKERAELLNNTSTQQARSSFYTKQFDEELRAKLLPNHYSNIREHTLTIKLAAQRLLDHYPFSNAQEAIRAICNTRIGLADLGLEYEPHKTPLITNQQDHKNLRKPRSQQSPIDQQQQKKLVDNERAIGITLQQHQRSYQNMTQMKHDNIILPLSLMLDSPAVHVPGLALYTKVPKKITLPNLDQRLDSSSSNDDEYEHVKHVEVDADGHEVDIDGADSLDTKAAHAKHVASILKKNDTFQMKWTKRYNLMAGTEHIDATLAELYWRGITITPTHVFDIISRSFDMARRLGHVPQPGLMVLPYLAALTHNMKIFPILDQFSRPAHSMSSMNTRQHHTIHNLEIHHRGDLNKKSIQGDDMVNEVEERVIQQFSANPNTNNHHVALRNDNIMTTLNKLTGSFVTYQHQIIQLQLNTVAQLHKQLGITLVDIISSIQTPSTYNFNRQRQLVPWSNKIRAAREKSFTPRSVNKFSHSIPYPSLTTSIGDARLAKPTDTLGFTSALEFVSLISDHFHGFDMVLRRLVDYLPPLNNVQHKTNQDKYNHAKTKQIAKSIEYEQLIDDIIAAPLPKSRKSKEKLSDDESGDESHDTHAKDKRKAALRNFVISNHTTAPNPIYVASPTQRSPELHHYAAQKAKFMNDQLNKLDNKDDTTKLFPFDSQLTSQFIPIISDLLLPTSKPRSMPRYYNHMRDNAHLNTSTAYVQEVPIFTPQATNYTESSILHIPTDQHAEFVTVLSQLPLLQANINHILFHPQYSDDFLLRKHDLIAKGIVSSNFDFAPRITTNNKQSQLVFMLLARYKQPGHILEQHLVNWHDSSQHSLEMIHLAFKQLFNMDLSNRGNAISPDDPHFGSPHRINQILKSYSKQDPDVTRAQLITGLIDIAETTLPTAEQLDWFRDMVDQQNQDIELLEQARAENNAGSDDNDTQSASITHEQNIALERNIQNRKEFVTNIQNFLNEMDACIIELNSIKTYLPHNVQFNAVSTYTQHTTLTPAPYHPETTDVQSQSYKLWGKEALLTLQSIRLAPNNQQLAVLSNTGPIINFNMFDENYLVKHHKNDGLTHNPDLFPFGDDTDGTADDDIGIKSHRLKTQMNQSATPAEVIDENNAIENNTHSNHQ